ncbi:hypothetical protein DRJ48_01145 [Candidatus Woesearchaeota archaeon]|nr:hypothetical protein [Candidatus Woesearchaeota archaeon]RLE43378.1 MAG: hypothetical protein DRJ48_01145 [Candidatus Woesearchaeota archaeon]
MKSKRNELLLEVQLERLRVEREKAVLVLNKALFIYFVFLTVAILGFVNGYIKAKYLNILVVMGFIVLLVGTIPYVRVTKAEEKKLNQLEEELRRELS